ncbi:hypothetical protein K1X12_01150 [Hyphomonas sp. WL0036]|uniref:hypothetical protein n=1 Tax=Hyphomonas sediminis TaxID=2866160 RepID=UPI001C80B2C7|nr:hypothetical protein [Hyphomonas sediminis]MBY9065483.1 hypothetical protein [Hyphomonas sediminis]
MAGKEGFDGEIVLAPAQNEGAPEGIGLLRAKAAVYPGSQQVTLWLPADGWSGYDAFRITGPGGVIEEGPLTARLNGRIQILVATFPWPPGRYRVEVTHSDGWSHILPLLKLEAGAALPPAAPPQPERSEGPILYRDGLGNTLPDMDLELRAEATRRLAARFGRRLEFEGNARAGTIVYIEGDLRLRFYHEMCAGRVRFSIDVPPPDKWEAATGQPLPAREDILAFLAEETRRRQAPSLRAEIHDNRIDFVA